MISQVCNGIEMMITNRNNYNSVNTGIAVISLISKFHSDKFEINAPSVNRLWGKNNFPNILNSNGKSTNNEGIRIFQELSKKYYYIIKYTAGKLFFCRKLLRRILKAGCS